VQPEVVLEVNALGDFRPDECRPEDAGVELFLFVLVDIVWLQWKANYKARLRMRIVPATV
jgi:hypothetical protein